MLTSIIILTYNKLNYTKQCIESIRNNTAKSSYELIIVDNCSNDGTKEWLKSQKDIITIFNDKNLGFPKGCNQGIKISNGESILLLNNDVVVTENWLSNLTTCLYSSHEIGAVSSVSNSCPYYQTIETDYRSIEEMQSFATNYNISDSNKWEGRLKLIGFCMLIKREVIKKIGLLDEIFSPGNYEDDDYSIRIREAGYKLMLCNDTFIHHYGGTSFKENKGYSKLLKNNEAKFKEKWGFTSAKNMELNRNLIGLVDKSPNEKFKVLQIGCGCGATLLYLKNKYKNAELYGVDTNKKALEQADFLVDAFNEDVYNIDEICGYFSNIKFDYIFINHILLDRIENNEILYKMKKILADNGKIFVELKPLAKDKKYCVTTEKLIESLTKAKYKNIDGLIIKYENEVKEYIFSGENIENESMEGEKVAYKIEKKGNSNELQRKLKFLLRRIENNIEVEESREKVYELLKASHINLEDILFSTAKDIIKKDEVLNSVAAKCYEKGLYDNVIPLFQAAYEYNTNNSDVIYNLAYFLYELGEKKLSLTYFEKIRGINPEIDEFILKLKGEV
ncbi:glycosyltransferase [Clostridium hydrogenum]|uniref:glycosyltransferase n=1 Tax=Clostridium hydrogenum TaxID=2855764 RepID=UPI001F41756E|nr:glycosyltransferase [Clostridium hydrogenum]